MASKPGCAQLFGSPDPIEVDEPPKPAQPIQERAPFTTNTYTMHYELSVIIAKDSLRVIDIVLKSGEKDVHMKPRTFTKTNKCVMFPASKGRPTLIKVEGVFGKYDAVLTREGDNLVGELRKNR